MTALQVGACLFAALLGYGASGSIATQARHRSLALQAQSNVGLAGVRIEGASGTKKLPELVLSYWQRCSFRLGARAVKPLPFAQRLFGARSRRWFATHAQALGCGGLSLDGLCEIRLHLAGLGALLAAFFAALLYVPPSAMLLLCVVGFFLGSQLIFMVGNDRIKRRREALESELPEMLSIVSLGLRSGLSFERSFSLYALYFDTAFAQACQRAQQRWSLSLITREDALHELARSYDSALLEQVVESMLRSLRFGTALSENLDALAHEARSSYRSAQEERIAKAPVKMLIPTGTLILPALLILVMGPVLLEMLSGM